MTNDSKNVIPVSLALLMHVVIFGSLIFTIDFGNRNVPVVPLAIQATLVTEQQPVELPPVVKEAPPPKPDPVPDTSEQDRLRAEQQKRAEDARIEQERLNRIQKAKDEAEAERRRQEEAEKKRVAEEERKERERLAAEKKRQEEIERQRELNRQLAAEAEAARVAEIEAENSRLQAAQATAEQAYMFAIRSRVMNRWVRPVSATVGVECVANIKQLPGGEVVSVTIGECNGDVAVRQSIEAAIYRASPLPEPEDPSVFDREISLIFRPDEE